MTTYPPSTPRTMGHGRRRQPPPWPIWAAFGVLVFGNLLFFTLWITKDSGGDTVQTSATTVESSTTTPTSDGGTTTPTTDVPPTSGIGVVITASIQEDLSALGYYDGPIDGVYGDATIDAVTRFQADVGLEPDGRYGPETHSAVQAALGETQSQTVIEIQTALADQGYYTGEIDGIYGPGTVAAVMAAQEDLGVTVDGIVGPETIAAWQAGFGDDGGGAPAIAPTIDLTTSDGLSTTMDVTSCSSTGTTDLTLSAETETSNLELDASAGTGTILYESADGNREGTVGNVSVDTNDSVAASGSLSLSDESAEPATFTLTGQCP